ncbi:MAG: penicillin-binding protein 2 [Chitinophagales bacterium]|nr:penicillin-binding protein 2 [Chitinophagaceae bacterium]MBP9881986.1 penicillin-binding protein 2 [Chitinophagales bacterium]
MTDLFQQRRYTLQYAMIVVVFIFIARLFYLQVINKDYKQLANANVLRQVTVFPARGLVFDRNGKLIIDNQKEYDLWVIPGQVKELDTLGFCDLLGITDTIFRETLRKASAYSRYKPSLFVKGISVEKFATVQEELYLFPGFYGQVRTVRAYPYHSAAHTLGYISEVTPKQIAQSNGYYKQGDYIGTGGIEQSYEKALRGVKGTRFVLVDVHNREQGSFNQGKFDTAAIPGKNMISSIDIELQQYGEQLMNGKVGSVVAIEPRTGEVLAMVSSPSYDPALLTGQERGKNFRKLLMDSLTPLFVRPIKAAYPPGSTYKPTLALIALEEGAIREFTTYPCPGAYYVGSLRVGCHHSGFVPGVSNAIQHSCNSYFCNYFRRVIDHDSTLTVAQGLDKWKAMLATFGIGVKTGIDLPNEGYGFVPGSAYYDKLYGKDRWNSVGVVSLGIGQGELGQTPLQMANVIAAIANRGYWYTPHLVKKVIDDDSTLQRFFVKNQVPVDQVYFDMVIKGMERVVESGTGTVAQIPGVSIAGKTGTAENPHGKDHSLFVCYAPVEDPKIAIAVIVENAGFGSTYGAPIASLMMELYLNDTISTSRKYLEERMFNTNLIQ